MILCFLFFIQNTSSIGKGSNARKSADGIPAPHTMRVNDEKRRVCVEIMLFFQETVYFLLVLFCDLLLNYKFYSNSIHFFWFLFHFNFQRIHEASVAMMKKGLALLQIFAIRFDILIFSFYNIQNKRFRLTIYFEDLTSSSGLKNKIVKISNTAC